MSSRSPRLKRALAPQEHLGQLVQRLRGLGPEHHRAEDAGDAFGKIDVWHGTVLSSRVNRSRIVADGRCEPQGRADAVRSSRVRLTGRASRRSAGSRLVGLGVAAEHRLREHERRRRRGRRRCRSSPVTTSIAREIVLVLLEQSRHQTGGVRPCASGDAVLDPDAVRVSHADDSPCRTRVCAAITTCSCGRSGAGVEPTERGVATPHRVLKTCWATGAQTAAAARWRRYEEGRETFLAAVE